MIGGGAVRKTKWPSLSVKMALALVGEWHRSSRIIVPGVCACVNMLFAGEVVIKARYTPTGADASRCMQLGVLCLRAMCSMVLLMDCAMSRKLWSI